MQTKLLQCNYCGTPLDPRNIVDGVIECPNCQNVLTVEKPSCSPEAVQFLAIGEHELDTCRFDDAFEAYKKAAELSPDEPQAYFGMALSRFRIQFLKDLVNKKPQPICHEITDKKFSEDQYYLKALSLATSEQKAVYIRRANDIDDISKEFYRLKQQGIDYDIFICTKVTDPVTGKKTEDYMRSLEIYTFLKDKGYRPFYSETVLRGQTGSAYEANILYALYMSESMIIVCDKEEYLDTPWVKNEYTRFAEMIANEEKASGSIAIAYSTKVIEKLPTSRKNLQGINLSKPDAYFTLAEFVQRHSYAQTTKTPVQTAATAADKAGFAAGMSDDEFFERMEAYNKEKQRRAEEEERKIAIENFRAEQERRKAEEEERKRAEAERKAKEEAGRRMEEYMAPVKAFLAKCAYEGTVLKKYNGEESDVVIPAYITEIGDNAFKGCTGITSITLPDSVTSIGQDVFTNCYALKSITIPNSVTSIGPYAFTSCKSLTNITIPNSVTNIGTHAFLSCSGLTSLTIPNSVLSIGTGVLSGCGKVAGITVESGNTKYHSSGNCLIETESKTLIAGCKNSVIPNDGSVTSIGNYAFSACEGLANITIPSSVTSICDGAFGACTSLTSITIPNGVTSIGSIAFCDCTSLTSITIPNSVTSIDSFAFSNCKSLTSITIPNSVKSVADYICSGCDFKLKIFCGSKKNPEGWHSDWNKKVIDRTGKAGYFKTKWGVKIK